MLPAPAPVVVVQEDFGGQIATFDERVSQYLRRRVRVRIEGDCISACTLVARLPADRICVGEHATMQFHQAFLMNRFDPLDTSIRSEPATQFLLQRYPARIRAWISRMGGLTKDLIVLQGEELRALFRPCR